MKVVKMGVQVCVPDCVTSGGVRGSVLNALAGCVGFYAAEVDLPVEGEGGFATAGMNTVRPVSEEPARDEPPMKRRRRRVNANGEKCEVVDNGDGTATETRR